MPSTRTGLPTRVAEDLGLRLAPSDEIQASSVTISRELETSEERQLSPLYLQSADAELAFLSYGGIDQDANFWRDPR